MDIRVHYEPQLETSPDPQGHVTIPLVPQLQTAFHKSNVMLTDEENKALLKKVEHCLTEGG